MMRLLELLSSRAAIAVLLPALAFAAWSGLSTQPWFSLGAKAAFCIVFCSLYAGVILRRPAPAPES